MASFRSFPPPPPPNQNPLAQPPPPPPQSQRSNQYPPPPNQGFGGGNRSQPSIQPSSFPPNFNQVNPNSNIPHHGYGSSSHHYQPQPQQQQPPPQQQQQQQQQYPYMPTQPSYMPPPPQPAPPAQHPGRSAQPPQMYYPTSQYSQFNPHSLPPPPLNTVALPPPPPSSPPPNSAAPPPPPPPSAPPPSHPPPPPPSKETKTDRGGEKKGGGWRELDHPKHGHGHGHGHGHSSKQHKPVPSGRAPHLPNGPAGRVETEEERRLRKKKEYEKQRQEEKHRQLIKETQNTVLQKTQMLSSGMKGIGSMTGSRLGDKRTSAFLSGERIENRLKKPTTFLCKLKFRNELPDPTAQPKLMSLNTDKDKYSKYTITSLEKMHKPKLFVEADLGIPLDLLDISVYNPPSTKPPLAPEDEELLRDDESVTPVKQNGIKKKDRPTDKGVSWLVKTQYISPLSMDAAKTSLTEKQAKELRETRGGRSILENLNNRESQIKAIEASFEACKSHPVHATNDKLQPVEVLPLLPYFKRIEDQFVLATFDNDPTADSEIYGKIDKSVRDELESKAIMKSFKGSSSDPAKPDKFLAYMAPSLDELGKDIYNEDEDVSFNWIREYHYDVRGDDADDPTTYLVTFGARAAEYLPLPTKLVLRKRRATEGRSTEEVEHYPVPSRVTVRRRDTVNTIEVKESAGYTNSRGETPNSKVRRVSAEDRHESRHRVGREQDMDHFSEGEDDMSD